MDPWKLVLFVAVIGIVYFGCGFLWTVTRQHPRWGVLPAKIMAFRLFIRNRIRHGRGPVLRMLNELLEEYGPQLQSSTNRNAIMLAITGFLGTFLPADWAAAGALYLTTGLTVFYLLRTMAARKRASGPIITKRDMEPARGPGAELEAHVAMEAQSRVAGDFYPDPQGVVAQFEQEPPPGMELSIGPGGEVRLAPKGEPVAEAPAPAPSRPRRNRRRPTPAAKKAAKKTKSRSRKRA